jgi:hypothetical protein
MILQYDPAVISVEEVQHGGFLSTGIMEIAIVQRVRQRKTWTGHDRSHAPAKHSGR